MCNRLPEIKKNGDAGIFPVYYSLKIVITPCSSVKRFANNLVERNLSENSDTLPNNI